MKGERTTRWPGWAGAALLLLPAVFLRLQRLDWMEFGNDEEMLILRSYRAMHEGALWGYQTSIGLRFPPFFVYLLGLPLLVTQDPVHLAVFIGGLNLAGLGLLFLFVRGFLGARVAWWATALMGYSPWAVKYARKVWNVDVIFPLVVALLLCVTSNARTPRRWKVVAAFALFTAASQVHGNTWFLVVPIVLFHLVFRIRVRAADLLLGLGASVLLTLPYLVYLVQSGFDNLLFVRNARASMEGPGIPFAERFFTHAANALDLSTGRGFEHALGTAAWEGFVASPLARALAALSEGLFALAVVATIAALLAAARAIVSGLRGRPVTEAMRGITLLALVLSCGTLAHAASVTQANHHYAVVFYPAVFVFLVWGLDRVLAGLRAPLAIGSSTVAAVALAQGLFMHLFMAWQRTDPPASGGIYAPPFALQQAARRELLARGFDNVLHGKERRLAEQASLERRFESCEEVLLRWDPARNEPPLTARGRAEIVPEADGVRVRRCSAVDMARLPAFEVPANRIVLLRLAIDAPDDTSCDLFFLTRDDPQYSGRQHRPFRLSRGPNTLLFTLDEAGIEGPILVRAYLHQWILRSLEVRATAP